MDGELANETVTYDTEIRTYQFESEVIVIKKGKDKFNLYFRRSSPEQNPM